MKKHTRRNRTSQWNFGKVLGRNLKGAFSGGAITDSGGIQLAVEVEKKRGLIESFSACIPDWRNPNLIDYTIGHQVGQRTLLVMAGYEDAIDSNLKRSDLAFSLALAQLFGNPNMASQSTICILENKIKAQTCQALHQWFLNCYIERRADDVPKEIILDIDGSSVPVHGNQEQSAYHGHYKTNQYFPLFIYDQDAWLIACRLRPGTESEDKCIVSELARIVPELRKKWPKVKIIIRADAGVYHPDICDWCEDNNVFYLMRLQSNGHGGGGLATESDKAAKTVRDRFRRRHGTERYVGTTITKSQKEKEIKQLPKKQRKEELERLHRRVERHFIDFLHRTGKGGKAKKQWRCKRRVVCVCKHTDWGGERTFFVTNLDDHPEDIVRNLYNPRGEMELHIRSMKALKCTKLSCMSFEANQFRLFLHGLAYLLMLQLRRLLPKSIRNLSIESIQKYLIRLPARVLIHARDYELAWSETFPFQNEFFALLRRLDRLRPLRC